MITKNQSEQKKLQPATHHNSNGARQRPLEVSENSRRGGPLEAKSRHSSPGQSRQTGKLRTLREGTESIVFVQYGAQGPRQTIRMLTGRSGAATTS